MRLIALGSPPFLERYIITVDGREIDYCAAASEEDGYALQLIVHHESEETISVEADDHGPVMKPILGTVKIEARE